MGDEMGADPAALGAEKREGLGGKAAPVPERREAAGDTGDLRTADGKAVVVEGLAEADGVQPALVEGEVDDRSLRAERVQRLVQAVGPGPGLEDKIGAAAVRPVPATLGLDPGLLLGQGLEAEAGGRPATPLRGAGQAARRRGRPVEETEISRNSRLSGALGNSSSRPASRRD